MFHHAGGGMVLPGWLFIFHTDSIMNLVRNDDRGAGRRGMNKNGGSVWSQHCLMRILEWLWSRTAETIHEV